MTLHFRSPGPSITSSRSYISRSLNRLMQRKTDFATATTGGSMGGRRRHLSVGCSKELFFDHTEIDAGDEADSIIACRSTSSTPSFADEKEVFDMLRQSSLAWEVLLCIFKYSVLNIVLWHALPEQLISVCSRVLCHNLNIVPLIILYFTITPALNSRTRAIQQMSMAKGTEDA